METQDLVDYYVNLLIAQYYTLSRARGTVEAYVRAAIANQIALQVRDAYNPDSAIGKQLDVLGRYVGADRYIKGLDLSFEYFAMPSYGSSSPGDYVGFYEYGDTVEDAFARYSDFITLFRLNDENMLKLIRLRILQNKSDHSLKDIDEIMNEFFSTDCAVIDSGNMELTYAFNSSSTDKFIKIAVFVGALPKPAGVKLNITGV